ncbi:hypothetical protein AB0J68_07045 [Micromonospora sp. NPDC049580]|uniref:hypothetical protein n=1 Tax=Micromonospora sp. NPDC049580 TaxID=3154832 RepID=UPI0034341B4D
MFAVPAGGSIVRETIGGYSVDVTVGGVVVASASVSPDALTACRTTAAAFNLIIGCRPSPYKVTLRIKNATDEARQYKLVKQRGEELTGTGLPSNALITEDWVRPTGRWKLEIAGYGYVRLVNEPSLFNTPTPTVTPSSTPSPPALATPAPPTTTPLRRLIPPRRPSIPPWTRWPTPPSSAQATGWSSAGWPACWWARHSASPQRSVFAAGRRSSVRPS